MITGVHNVLFTKDVESTRSFLSNVLGLASVDAGGGWLIFALPPTELGIHPTDGDDRIELYLMCDRIESTIEELKAAGVGFSEPVRDEGWGLLTTATIPGGAKIALYEPRHPTAIG